MVYVIQESDEYCKIGIAMDVEKRLDELQLANPRRLKVRLAYDTSNSLYTDRLLEAALHNHFKDRRIVLENGRKTEWFKYSVLEDLLAMSDKEIESIVEHDENPFIAQIRDKKKSNPIYRYENGACIDALAKLKEFMGWGDKST